MKKMLPLIVAMGLLSFVGCDGGGDGADGSDGGTVGSVNLRSATPEISGGITFEPFNSEFDSSGRGWRTSTSGAYMRFRFNGKYGFKFHAGGDSRGSTSCIANVSVNGNRYWSNHPIPIGWADFIIPDSAFGTDENTVDIEQGSDLTMFIVSASVGNGDDYNPDVGGGGNGRYNCTAVGTFTAGGGGWGDTEIPVNSSFTLNVSGGTITSVLYGATRSGTIDGSGTFRIQFTDEFGSTITFDGNIDSSGHVHGTYRISGLDGYAELNGSRA